MTADSPRAPADAQWSEVRRLFDAAWALPRDERDRFVGQAEATASVRSEVRALLAHAEAAGDGWLDEPAPALAGPPDDLQADASGAQPGQRFGAWCIVRLLGQGGMGEVYEARRADGQFEGRAAIKLLKRGMDSKAVLARFALERSALARLSHPHIARLFDAGLSEAGLPYFVMEYVDGRPIDAAAAEMPLEGKLALFLQLADAVAHAHRHLLLHRDLKPGNVLVTGDGQVKLLDFGIAKALDPLEAGIDGGQTSVHAPRPFTPHYASPEQVRGEPADTATDVYSLGVLLYELLTGVRPTGRAATSPLDAARSVLEEQPKRPSALTRTDLPPRAASAQWLATRRRLRGDLDNILLKSLDKSREGRYRSVDAFAEDIRAFIAGRPVSARSPSLAYLLGRFVRRHRVVVALSALALLAVLGGSGLALWQAHEAARQRDLAQQRFNDVRHLANQLVFKYHDQIATLAGASQARAALLADAGAFLDGLARAAADDAGLAQELAGTWYRLSSLQGGNPVTNTGQFTDAERSLDKALDLTRRYRDRADISVHALTEVVNMHTSRAEMWQARGQLRQADATLRAGVALLDRADRLAAPFATESAERAEVHASAVSLHGVHARILGNQMGNAHLGRWREACVSADRAHAAAEATARANPRNKFLPDTLGFTIGEQALCRRMAGRYAEADALFARATELRDRMAAAMPEDIDFRYQRATPRVQRARLWSEQGRHADARRLFDEGRDLLRLTVAADADNAAGQRRLHELDLYSAELWLRAGAAASARRDLARVLEAFPVPRERRFVDVAVRAEALVGIARALSGEAPAAAQRAAAEAVELLQPAAAGDDNRARVWMLARALLAQGDAALAAGDAASARRLARAAAEAFGGPGSADAEIPPWLRPEAEAARRLGLGA